MKIENIDIREEQFSMVHNMKPNWWMNWGVMIICGIIGFIFALGYIIEYPDVITAEIELVTDNPSITLPFAGEGQVEKILIPNNGKVHAGGPVLIMRSNANFGHIMQLDDDLHHFGFEREYLIEFFEKYLASDLQLGSMVESQWITFSKDLLEFYRLEKLRTYDKQIDLLDIELRRQRAIHSQYKKLVDTDARQRLLLLKQAGVDSVLYHQQVTSNIDYLSSRQLFYSKQSALEQNAVAMKRVEFEIVKLRNGIEQVRNQMVESRLLCALSLRKSLNALRSAIETWKRSHMLVSPIKGSVNYLQHVEEGKFYNGNAVAIVPEDTAFFGLVHIPIAGAGKVQMNQRVIIKINDYPYKEYGVLVGTVDQLYAVSNDNRYVGKIALNRMTLTGRNRMPIRNHMLGTADIVTRERSILERVFQSVLYVFRKKELNY